MVSILNTKKLKIAFDVFITDPVLFAKEITRRLFKRSYYHRGVLIENGNEFGTLYLLKKYRNIWKLEKINGEYYIINTKHNIKLWAPKKFFGAYSVVIGEENLDLKQYSLNTEEVRNKKVLDVGAYVGDTVIGFVLKEAKYVVGIEPVYYEIARKNLEINNIKNAEIRDYGLADKDFSYKVDINMFSAAGLAEGNFEIKTKSWEDLLKSEDFDLAKVDCEGCELYLLTVPDELLRKIPLWIIEIHGVYLPLVNKFKRAGFKATMIKKLEEFVTIWRFEI